MKRKQFIQELKLGTCKNLHAVNPPERMAEILEGSRAQLPPWLLQYLPADAAKA